MTTYPAITIWQPWATLIAIGAKPYEFRGWAAPRSMHGRRIAIHAGARLVRLSEVRDLVHRLTGPDPASTALIPDIALPLLERLLHARDMLPRASVLCLATLGRPIHGQELLAALGGDCNDSDRAAHTNFGWPLTDITVLEPFQPATGHQGFWNWTMPSDGSRP